MKERVVIKREDLEWIIEQLEYLQETAGDVEDEAYRCKKEVRKILKQHDRSKIKHN